MAARTDQAAGQLYARARVEQRLEPDRLSGANPRVAIDNAVTVINREIVRKMTEFGYIRNGERVRTMTIPTIETVKEWMAHAN